MTQEKLDDLNEGIRKCDALLSNPDVAWLIEQTTGKNHREAVEARDALATEPLERDRAAHRAAVLAEVREFLGKHRAVLVRQLPQISA